MLPVRDHAAFTDTTAIYPEAGTGSMTALTYIGLGLGEETSEVVEKELAGDIDGVATELGDVLWYLSRFHRELGVDPDLTVSAALKAGFPGPAAATDLVVAAGRVQGLVKKALRDDAGVLTRERRTKLTGALVTVLVCWLAVHARHDLDPAAAVAANITKLRDRKARHVLAGSGDHR